MSHDKIQFESFNRKLIMKAYTLALRCKIFGWYLLFSCELLKSQKFNDKFKVRLDYISTLNGTRWEH